MTASFEGAIALVNRAHLRNPLLGYAALLLLLAYAGTVMVAGFAGLAHHLSLFGTVVLFAAMIGLKLHLPFLVAAFLGLWKAWQVHWLVALLFLVPPLVAVLRDLVPAVAVPARLGARFRRG